MKICQVERPLVSTNRIAMMEHKHLQVVIDGSSKLVAVDAVGAKPGDWVICVGSSAAREAAGSKGYPSDLTIVGIIDHWPPAGEGEGDAVAADSASTAAQDGGEQDANPVGGPPTGNG
jgi:ethanolamine utilization protein EutN